MEFGKSQSWLLVFALGLAFGAYSTDLSAQADPDVRILSFSVSGITLDTSEVIEVLVNNRAYGYLVTDVSNQPDDEQIACVDVGDLTVNVNDNQIKLRETLSGNSWNATNFSVAAVADGELCLATVSAFIPLPANPDRLQGSSQAYGISYEQASVTDVPVTFSLSQQNPTPGTFDGIAVRRDVRVKFTTKHGTSASHSNRTLIEVNGIQRVATESYSTGNERSYDFIINRNFLRLGVNTFVFKPFYTTANKPWGIRNISIEYIEAISLAVGAEDTQTYGYNQTPSRYTGLRANFNLAATTNDYGLSVSGGAINVADETQVFLNGNSIGFLTPGGSGFSQADQFILANTLLLVGANQIEFVQRYPGGVWSGATQEQWAVKDISLGILTPDLAVASIEILDRVINSNNPFQVSSMIANNGGIASSATTLRFFASTDNIFSVSDTLIASAPLASINKFSAITMVQSIQSALVNKGLFLVVCADLVSNEVVTSNNCSTGIPLKGIAVIAPIMLLLDE